MNPIALETSPMKQKQFHLVSDIYANMDEVWDKTAAQYGFFCEGCEDNCCTSLFFHHTFIEKAYLVHGFNQLATDIKRKALSRAGSYYQKTFPDEKMPTSLKLICPLNQEGRCMVYQHRPMICRLHGIPHELHRPGAEAFKGPGCSAGPFEKHLYIPFDRTPFYKEMARAEMEFRKKTGKAGKIKETVAQRLLF